MVTRIEASSTDDAPLVAAIDWYKVQAEKPAFLAVELTLALGLLALIDGGFSGWYLLLFCS